MVGEYAQGRSLCYNGNLVKILIYVVSKGAPCGRSSGWLLKMETSLKLEIGTKLAFTKFCRVSIVWYSAATYIVLEANNPD